MRATKSVIQRLRDGRLDILLQDCLTLTYNAIHYGEENGIANRKGMKGFYRSLSGVELLSCYKMAVITRACAVLKSRNKSAKRGIKTCHPKPLALWSASPRGSSSPPRGGSSSPFRGGTITSTFK